MEICCPPLKKQISLSCAVVFTYILFCNFLLIDTASSILSN